MPSGVTVASEPPARCRSASPHLIERQASPIEFAPVAHAVTMQRFGPRSRSSWETSAPAAFPIIAVMENGETRAWPPADQLLRGQLHAREPADARADHYSRPVAIDRLQVKPGVVHRRIRAAPSANCMNRSARRSPFASLKNGAASNPATSPAILHGYSVESKEAYRLMPLWPASGIRPEIPGRISIGRDDAESRDHHPPVVIRRYGHIPHK